MTKIHAISDTAPASPRHGYHWLSVAGKYLIVGWVPDFATARAELESAGAAVLPPLHAPGNVTAAHAAALGKIAAVTAADTPYTAVQKLHAATAWPPLNPELT